MRASLHPCSYRPLQQYNIPHGVTGKFPLGLLGVWNIWRSQIPIDNALFDEWTREFGIFGRAGQGRAGGRERGGFFPLVIARQQDVSRPCFFSTSRLAAKRRLPKIPQTDSARTCTYTSIRLFDVDSRVLIILTLNFMAMNLSISHTPLPDMLRSNYSAYHRHFWCIMIKRPLWTESWITRNSETLERKSMV